MKLILDTNVLIWWLGDAGKISQAAKTVISSPDNLIFISAASACEIAIKKSLGKLSVPDDLTAQIERNNFTPLPIKIEHGLYLEQLPFHHKDPFDRLIIAQAILEKMTIVTSDNKFRLYQGLSIVDT